MFAGQENFLLMTISEVKAKLEVFFQIFQQISFKMTVFHFQQMDYKNICYEYLLQAPHLCPFSVYFLWRFFFFLESSSNTVITFEYWDRQACASSVEPDQMLQNAISVQGLSCLLHIQQYFRHIKRL